LIKYTSETSYQLFNAKNGFLNNTIIGHDRNFCLRGGNMTSPDIRAGIALLIAALGAEGNSRIHNIEQIDRGYQNIEQRLTALGARITRIE